MEKIKNSNGLLVMLGLAIIGCMLPLSVVKWKSYDRTVSVKGLCEREVKADKAIWPVSFKVVGNELGSLNAEIDRNTASIVEFLKAGGIPDNEITVALPKVSDKFAQEYGGNERTFRYVASCTVTVCSSMVDEVLALMANQSALLKRGIVLTCDWDCTPQFNFESLNEVKPGMIEEATKNAREVAEKFAKDSDSRLGKIKDASQGTFSIENRDSNTPYIKKVRIVTYVTYYLSN